MPDYGPKYKKPKSQQQLDKEASDAYYAEAAKNPLKRLSSDQREDPGVGFGATQQTPRAYDMTIPMPETPNVDIEAQARLQALRKRMEDSEADSMMQSSRAQAAAIAPPGMDYSDEIDPMTGETVRVLKDKPSRFGKLKKVMKP